MMWSDGRRKSVAAGVREPERMNHNLGAGGLAYMHNRQAYQEEQYQKRMAQDKHRMDLERQIEEVRQRREAERMRKRLEDEAWEMKNNPNFQQQAPQYTAPRAPPPKIGVEAPVRSFAQVPAHQPYQPAAPSYSSGIRFQKPAPAPVSYSPRGLDLNAAAGRIRPTRLEPFQINSGMAPTIRDYPTQYDTQLTSMFQGDFLDRHIQNHRTQPSTDQTLQVTASKVNQPNSSDALLQYSGYETAVNTSSLLPDVKQNRGLVMSDLKTKRNQPDTQSNNNFKIDFLFGKNTDRDDMSERSVFDVPQIGSKESSDKKEDMGRILPAEAFEGISYPDLLREAPKEKSETANRTVEELEYSSELIPPQRSIVRPTTSASMQSIATTDGVKSLRGSIRPVSCLSQPSMILNTPAASPTAADVTHVDDKENKGSMGCIINMHGTVFELCTEDEIRRGGLELVVAVVSEAEADTGAVITENTVDMLNHLMTGSLGGTSLSFNTLKAKIMPRQSWVFSPDRRTVTCRLQPCPAFRISTDEVVAITFPFSSISNSRCELCKSCPTTFTIRSLDSDGCL
eukprot:TRINITY_DN7021_c1_g1_i1.p1 TRINITY_DN7021_c1_g1~~TRINITY_DN7021_c1_g1_i1.p1  ORF type:complete len:582 (+),score=105.13 TRINITY_DN7021_c1_g1_i1:44-1747(+)